MTAASIRGLLIAGRDVDPCSTFVRSGSHVHGHGHRLHRQRAAGRHHHRRSRGEAATSSRRLPTSAAQFRLPVRVGAYTIKSRAERLYHGQSDGADPHRPEPRPSTCGYRPLPCRKPSR